MKPLEQKESSERGVTTKIRKKAAKKHRKTFLRTTERGIVSRSVLAGVTEGYRGNAEPVEYGKNEQRIPTPDLGAVTRPAFLNRKEGRSKRRKNTGWRSPVEGKKVAAVQMLARTVFERERLGKIGNKGRMYRADTGY